MKMMKAFTLSLATTLLLSFPLHAQEEAANDPFVSKSTASHEIILLNHGLGSLEKRLEIIEKAQKTIDVEYFIYRTDKSAKLFTQALVKKARQGVKVRMLLDYFMVKSDLTPFYAAELEKSGIQVRYFNTTSTLNLFSGQYRNHRKILLVDGEEVITGGRNIGDEYFDLHKDYNFMDRELHIKGELVKDIETTFNETFNAKKSERVDRGRKPDINDAKYRNARDGHGEDDFIRDAKNWNKKIMDAYNFVNQPMDAKLEAEIRQKGAAELSAEYNGVCNEMSFHSEYPSIGTANRKNNRVIKHFIFDEIEKSEGSIMIDSPYFIVNDELGQSLDHALAKNVDIKLLTNSLNSTDAIYVYAAFDSIVTKWLKKGLDSYIFKGKRPESYEVLEDQSGEARFGVHAKTFIFDKKDVVIGTYNVDPRSANFNAEMVVACQNNPELAEAVQKDIDTRLANSLHLDSEKAIKDAEFYQTGFGKKILYFLLKVPSNIFGYLL